MLCITSTASLLTLQMDHLRTNHFSCVIFLFDISSFQSLGHFNLVQKLLNWWLTLRGLKVKNRQVLLSVCAEEHSLTALYDKTHRLLKYLFSVTHVIGEGNVYANRISTTAAYVAISNRLALAHYKFIWNRAHLVTFHLCYSAIELQWTSMLRMLLLLT